MGSGKSDSTNNYAQGRELLGPASDKIGKSVERCREGLKNQEHSMSRNVEVLDGV